MTDYSNMLECAAAHLLTQPAGTRIHITDMQLSSACETQTTLEVWATLHGLCTESGAYRGYTGFWLSLDTKSPTQ